MLRQSQKWHINQGNIHSFINDSKFLGSVKHRLPRMLLRTRKVNSREWTAGPSAGLDLLLRSFLIRYWSQTNDREVASFTEASPVWWSHYKYFVHGSPLEWTLIPCSFSVGGPGTRAGSITCCMSSRDGIVELIQSLLWPRRPGTEFCAMWLYLV